jgi:hypothetical protein
MITLAWTVAVLTAMVARRPMPLGASQALSVLLALLMGAGTLWCAFGDERWRLSPGVLEHRVGLRRWAYVQRIEDPAATLTIVFGYGNQFSTPFFRLYALASGERHFLIERPYRDLKTLADFIAAHTGWAAESS